MKKLIVSDVIYTAERIIKNPDSIIGKNGDLEIFAFRGISDFSIFSLGEGQEWDVPEIEQIRLEMARSNTELFETMLALFGGV